MADIFISYTRKDQAWAAALARRFTQQGWSVWWDRKLPTGVDYEAVTEAELDAARCVIVLWSAASKQSTWVRVEATEGLERNILIPVCIEAVRPPLKFRHIQTANLVGWDRASEDERVPELLRHVEQLLGPGKTPPKPEYETKAPPARSAPAERESRRHSARKPPEPPRRAISGYWWKGALGVVTLVGLGYLVYSGVSTSGSTSVDPPPVMVQAEPGDNSTSTQNESPVRHVAPFTAEDFVEIPAGTFMMGSDGYYESFDREKPVHEVTLTKPFLMMKTEVTQAQWYAVMGTRPSRFTGDQLPVESVSWNDVQEFIKKLNETCSGCYRLPTEAEWEYAARAGSSTAYSFGDNEEDLAQYGWYGERWDEGSTHPVGEKQPNQWGLYDMHGNVWEWVADGYGDYEAVAVVDPVGREDGSSRVIRGGSWSSTRQAPAVFVSLPTSIPGTATTTSVSV